MEIDPIVVAYADADHPHEVMNVAMCEGNYGCEVPLMTVAQHERIVAGLEARLRDAGLVCVWAHMLATHVHGHFAYPSDSSPTVCKDMADKTKATIDAFLAQTAEGVEGG